ncbi:MAG: hypothetical protein V4436_01635, partial [Patescibacteria group bacterium]
RGFLRKIEKSEGRTLPAGRQGSFLYEPTTEILGHLGLTSLHDLPEYEQVRAKLDELEFVYKNKAQTESSESSV